LIHFYKRHLISVKSTKFLNCATARDIQSTRQMSEDPGNRFDRWKVDLVGTFFGVLPEQATDAAIDSLEGEEERAEDIEVVGAEGKEARLDDLETSFGKEEFKIEVVFVDVEDTSDQVQTQQIEDIDKDQVVDVEALDEEHMSEEESKDVVVSAGGEANDSEVVDHPKLEKDAYIDREHAVEEREGLEGRIKEEVQIHAVMECREEVNDVKEVKVVPKQFDEVIAGFVEKREDVKEMMLVEEPNKESSLRGRKDKVKIEMDVLLKIENVDNVDVDEKKGDDCMEVSYEIIDTIPALMKEVIDVATEETENCEAVSNIIIEELDTMEVYEAATLIADSEVTTRVVNMSFQAGKIDDADSNVSLQFDVENSTEESEVVKESESIENEPENLKGKEYEIEQVAKVRVGIVGCDGKETVKTSKGNVKGESEDVEALIKSPCKVIDIEDSQESDGECEEERDLTLVQKSKALEAAEMMMDLILDTIPYKGPTNEAIHPGNLQNNIGTAANENAVGPFPACKDKPRLNVSDDVTRNIHADDTTPCITKIKVADNDDVTVAPIDASKVAFACLDVRLKTGFPAKVVLKVKNCVSIILSGHGNRELMRKLGNLGSEAGLLKFYSQSRVMNGQVRKDLVFHNERDAVKFYKSNQSNRSLKSFLLMESDLGFGSAPVLSEPEMMYIITKNKVEKNMMKMFDGKVVQDCDGKIQFMFSSLASLNLFLHHTGGPDDTALGMLRKNLTEEKPMVLQGSRRRKTGNEVFKLDVVHSVIKKKPSWKFGWDWDNLKETCNFIVGDTSSTRRVLIFESKLSMFEFWAGITAKLLSEVKILDAKLKEFVSSEKLVRNIQFDNDEILRTELMQIKETNMNKDQRENQDTRLKEAKASCIDDNLTEEPREVGDVGIEEKSKKRKGNERNLEESGGVLKSGKFIQDEILARKALEIEMKTLKLETVKLKVDLKIASSRLEALEIEVKNKNEAIATLEERLVLERKAVINLEYKLEHQEMERKIEGEVARRTLENQINSLADYDPRQDEYYNDRRSLVIRNLTGSGRRSSQVPRPYTGPPQISWTNILSLRWIREDESGGNYVSCLWAFLRDIAGSLESVFKIGEEIILKFKSLEKLNKALWRFATEEGRDLTRLNDMKQRARLKPDELYGNYCLNVFYTEENFHLHSKKQLLEDLRRANGSPVCKEGRVMVTFPTSIAFVRALVSRKLWLYHRVLLVRTQFELIGGNGENNYFKGKVCLTESNLLSLYYKGEEEAGFAECFSNFLKNKRIMSVDLGRNDRLVVTFYSLKELEECLKDYCQVNCNTLAKLVKLPVRCKLVVKNTSYSLLCPSTAVKKDFIGYQDLCRLEAQPRRISSKSKLCLVQILRDLDKQKKYPEIHFIEDNFYWKFKRGPSKPREVEAVNVLDDSQDIALDHALPGEGREITSDYEESVYSEAAGGLDGRH